MNETVTTSLPARSRSVIEREKRALAAHRAALRGSDLPPPDAAPKGTFLHGFFLPFSLIIATMRDGELRRTYLRVAFLRGLIVTLVAVVAVAAGSISASKPKPGHAPGIVVHRSRDAHKPSKPVQVDVPGLHVRLDEKSGEATVSFLGQKVPVTTIESDGERGGRGERATTPAAPAATGLVTGEAHVASGSPSLLATLFERAVTSWKWLLALVTFLSGAEFVVVFLSRRWDDWLSFHASRLVATRPEDDAPKTPKLAFDLRWLYRKLKRRVRGYVVFFAGFPALLPLRLVPVAGAWLFPIGLTLWGWYWLGVFTAAKSAHAWADEEQAPSPAPIRAFHRRVAGGFFFGPLRWYGRSWAWITRGVNAAAATFERTPAPFLGLALARVVLSLPGLYLLARPIVPVAAGRLCAEADPAARFSVAPPRRAEHAERAEPPEHATAAA